MDMKVSHPEIKVQPILPGCIVTPPSLSSDFLKDKDKLKFFITPISKGNI